MDEVSFGWLQSLEGKKKKQRQAYLHPKAFHGARWTHPCWFNESI